MPLEAYEFVKAFLRASRPPDPAALDGAGEVAGRWIAIHQRIVRRSVLLGCLLVFLSGIGFAHNLIIHPPTRDISVSEGICIGFLCLLLAVFMVIPGTMFGFAVCCLFAPRDFLISPVGVAWMKLIGVRNVLGARMVCLLGALAVGSAILAMPFVYRYPVDRPGMENQPQPAAQRPKN